jgi:hypothetical protein
MVRVRLVQDTYKWLTPISPRRSIFDLLASIASSTTASKCTSYSKMVINRLYTLLRFSGGPCPVNRQPRASTRPSTDYSALMCWTAICIPLSYTTLRVHTRDTLLEQCLQHGAQLWLFGFVCQLRQPEFIMTMLRLGIGYQPNMSCLIVSSLFMTSSNQAKWFRYQRGA